LRQRGRRPSERLDELYIPKAVQLVSGLVLETINMTFTLLPPASLLSDASNGWCITDEVQDELEREQPLLGVRPWRLQFGGELRHLVDHAGQLGTDRSWRIWRQGPAAVAGPGHIRVVDLQIHEVPTLRVVVVVSPAVASGSSPIAAPSIIVIMPCAWLIFVEIFVQVPQRTIIGTGLTSAIETLLMSTPVSFG
jgi:hypothetical protein